MVKFKVMNRTTNEELTDFDFLLDQNGELYHAAKNTDELYKTDMSLFYIIWEHKIENITNI